jgi:hypothetical protein
MCVEIYYLLVFTVAPLPRSVRGSLKSLKKASPLPSSLPHGLPVAGYNGGAAGGGGG